MVRVDIVRSVRGKTIQCVGRTAWVDHNEISRCPDFDADKSDVDIKRLVHLHVHTNSRLLHKIYLINK